MTIWDLKKINDESGRLAAYKNQEQLLTCSGSDLKKARPMYNLTINC